MLQQFHSISTQFTCVMHWTVNLMKITVCVHNGCFSFFIFADSHYVTLSVRTLTPKIESDIHLWLIFDTCVSRTYTRNLDFQRLFTKQKPISGHFTKPNTKAGLARLPLYLLSPGRTKLGKLCIQPGKMASCGWNDLYKLIKGIATPNLFYASVV
jgi:hypothetical protein